MSNVSPVSASVLKTQAPLKKRKLYDVPFVELYGRRVHGVVTASSDPGRVYVCFFEAGTTDFSCSTNNNRRCAGLGGRGCKHLYKMLEEAALQYGVERVARHLELTNELPTNATGKSLQAYLKGKELSMQTGVGFSRFLSYLRFVELPPTTAPIPEMSWFT